MTSPTGTSHRVVWVLFIAGPVLWFGHFMAVYLFTESVCAAEGFDPEPFGMGIIELVTLATTVLAAAFTLALTAVAFRRWRSTDPSTVLSGGEGDGGLALAGALLGGLSVIAILFVGLPAAFLNPC